MIAGIAALLMPCGLCLAASPTIVAVPASTPLASEAPVTPDALPPIEISLWKDAPPDTVSGAGPGADDGTGRFRNVGIPSMYVYLPKLPGQRRTAIIACPGGSYTHLTRLLGADGAVNIFAPKNIVVISLKYRLQPPLAASDVEAAAVADGQQAVRLVRAHAKEWGIDPAKIGVLGWSAGANLALNLAVRFDQGALGGPDPIERFSSRPDFVVLMSPWPHGKTLADYPVPKNAPPAFIGTAKDDTTAPPAFAEGIADAYHKLGLQAQLMVVDTGGHGAYTFGGPGPGGQWVTKLWPWLESIKMWRK